jgi:hypothetical protein
MIETTPKSNDRAAQTVALLCVSDVAGTDGEAPLALTLLYGRPFLHHLIKSLESLGISRFFVGIDAIPGALLSYGDKAKQEGLDVRFVRNPSELAAQIDERDRVLVQSADTIWEQSLVGHAIARQNPLIATVEEQADNQRFERIDLNSRWGGLAVLEKRSLSVLTALPDGWDMGSALLRQGLQDGVALWPVAQRNVQAGLVRKLASPDDLAAAMAIFASPDDKEPKSLEKLIFSPLATRILPGAWSTNWSRSSVEWLFPGLAGLSAAAAGLSMPLVAATFAIGAIFSAMVRKKARILEYQTARSAWLGLVGWALLALGLGSALYHAEVSQTEGIFVVIMMTGTAIFARNYWKEKDFWISSPLIIAIAAMAGHAAGLTGWAVRLLLLAELASLLLSQLRTSDRKQMADDQA